MIDLSAVTPIELSRLLPEVTVAEARLVVSRVHRGKSLMESFAGVRRAAMAEVRTKGRVPRLDIVDARKSALDPFVKYTLSSEDSAQIETVRIPLEREGRFSACVSSQVGCGLGCTFCKTGTMGLVRNLRAWEIVDQVRTVRDALKAEIPGSRVHGVVFQGMGEPLANLDQVLTAIGVMCDPSALAIDARAITVCTSGLPSGIVRLAKEAPRVRLGWSVASARRDVRRSLMPIDEKHSIDDVLLAVCEHALVTDLSPMWAVTLLSGVNDFEEDAHALGDLVARFTAKTNMRPRVSIVPYNDIGDEHYRRSDETREQAYFQALRTRGVYAHKRYSGGSDVGAACGQLATQPRSPSPRETPTTT